MNDKSNNLEQDDTKKLRFGKIQNDFLEVKMQIREAIEKMTPEKKEELEKAIQKIDDLIKDAEYKYING